MTSTMAWLEQYDDAELALSLVFHGYPLVYTTHFDTEGIRYAFASDSGQSPDWPTWVAATETGATVRTGLHVVGTIGQGVKLFAPDIEADTLEFTITDHDDKLLQTMLREGNTDAGSTYLLDSLSAESEDPIEVKLTDDFTAGEDIYIGGECIGTDSLTGGAFPSFDDTTRGKYSLFGTQTVGVPWRPAHRISQDAAAGVTTAPAVSSHPRTWVGRFVTLLLHHRDRLLGQNSATSGQIDEGIGGGFGIATPQWSKPSEARQLWVGRIQSYRDNGDGSITISCKGVKDLLNNPVLTEQWKGRINAGVDLSANPGGRNYLTVASSQPVIYFPTPVGLAGITGRVSHDQLAAAMNDQFATWQAAATIHAGDQWSIGLVTRASDGAVVYQIQLVANTTALAQDAGVAFAMHPDALRLLGFTQAATGPSYVDSNTGALLQPLNLVVDTGASPTRATLMAAEPPIQYEFDPVFGTDWAISEESGTWVNQETIHGDMFGAEGCVQVGSEIFAVAYATGTLTFYGRLNMRTRLFESLYVPGQANGGQLTVRDAGPAPEAKQVWYERGPAGQLLLQVLLSSGSAGFNSVDYDVYAMPGFGLNVPYSLVDVSSWRSLDLAELELLVTEPTPFYKLLEPVLAVTNRHVVWKSSGQATAPKLAIATPAYESAIQASWALTEHNKAGAGSGAPDRSRATRSPDGVVNAIEFEFGHDLDGKNPTLVKVENMSSQSDFGRPRVLKVKAPGVLNAEELLQLVAAPALAYLARPPAVIERTINVKLLRMAPCDSVALTDSYLANPLTGVRGVTSLPCWCLQHSLNLGTGKGQVQLLFLPERDPSRTAPWAWSARVDESAANAGYDAGTQTLTLEPNAFSVASEGADVDEAEVGDSVRVGSLDESAPLEWFTEITAKVGNTVTLADPLTGWDTAKRYVVEYDDISTVANAAQRNHAFIADDDDESTGYTTPDPYQWGVDPSADALPAEDVDYQTPLGQPDSGYAAQGEPLSVHKAAYLAHGLNNLLGRAGLVYLSSYKSISQLGTNRKLAYLAWIPLYGHVAIGGIRKLKVRVRGSQIGGGDALVRVSSCPQMPTGSFTAPTLPAFSTNHIHTISSGTDVWTDMQDLTPAPAQVGGVWGTWIVVEVAGSAGGITGVVSQVAVFEKELG